MTSEKPSLFDTIRGAIRGDEQDFTSGSLKRGLVLLSIPMVLEMLMESLFGVIDIYFVAKVDVLAAATVGLTESVVTLVFSLAIGISAAATAMVARRAGEKDPEGAARAAAQSIILGVSVAAVIGLLGAVFAEDVLRFMGAEEAVVASGKNYTRIILGTNVVIMLLFLLNGIFRGAGNAAIAMQVLWIANIINIILDPLLIFGIGPFPELGVTGAAIATSIGRGIGVMVQLYILFNGKSYVKLAWRHFKIVKKTLMRLIGVAKSGAGQYLVASASWVFLMRIVSESGSDAVAGYVIAIRVFLFTLLPVWGMANAAATLVGQNLGANQPERSEAAAWLAARYAAYILTACALCYWLFAPQLIGLFSQETPVLEAGVLTLRIFAVGYVIFAYGMVLSQAFNGAGDTKTPLWINFVSFWLVEIPLGYLLAIVFGFGLAGVCWAVVSAETLLTILVVLLFRRGKWKKTMV